MAATAFIPRALLSKYLSAKSGFTLNARGYARFAHRNPVRILTSEEANNLNKPALTFEEEQRITTPPNVKPFAKKTSSLREHDTKTQLTKKDFPSSTFQKSHGEERQEKLNDLYYTHPSSPDKRHNKTGAKEPNTIRSESKTKKITNVQIAGTDGSKIQLQIVNDKLTAERKLAGFMQNAKSSKARKHCGLIFLEGERLVSDAIKSGLRTKALFVNQPELLTKLDLPTNFNAEVYQVAYEKIQLWSELTTSPGLIGIFSLENINEVWSKTAKHVPITLICDNIRDPGNMGSIIRCGAAVGCRHIITTSDCVDIWDSKVLRGAAGAHFRVHLEEDLSWDVIAGNYISDNTSVILADNLQKRTRSPMSTEEIARLTTLIAEEEAAQESSSRSVEVLEGGDSRRRDSSYLNEKLMKLYRKLPLPQIAYSDIKLTEGQSAVLVIGGETQGLSIAAHKLAHENGGCKVFIPLENGVDSLNASVAAGILSYELRKKILASDLDKDEKSS